MSRIPFTLEAWLKDKNQRVETRDGRIVHDIWPVKNKTTIKAYQTEVCALIDGEEDALVFFAGGKYLPVNAESPFDLFIVTPEEELTDWEKAVGLALSDYQLLARDKDGIANIHDIEEFTKKKAAELLSLAKEQFIKDGYIIEKKAFHDAVEKINPEVIKEVSENVDFENFIHDLSERYPEVSFAKLTRIAKAAYDYGKAEALKDLEESGRVHCKSYDIGYDDGMKDALKDLPRWIPNKFDKHNFETCKAYLDRPRYLCYQNKMIDVSELVEKLPGFNEDENHE